MDKKISYSSTKISSYIGYFVQAIVNNFLPILFIALQDVYGIGYEKLGRLVMFNFVTQMITDILSPKIIAKTGYRKAAIMCQFTAAAGLAAAAFLPKIMWDPYWGIVIAIIIYAFASGLMEVILSPMIEMLPTDNKSGNMSLLHSFYCWGQAITTIGTTLLLHAFGYKGWSYIPLLWAAIPFFNAFSFFKVPIVEPEPERKSDSFKTLFKSRLFRCFMLMMLCSGAAEIAMAEWASMFAQKALGISKVIGDLAGPCAFAVFMGLGRVLYAAFSEKLSFKKTVIAMSVLCAACYYAAAFSKSPVLALSACALYSQPFLAGNAFCGQQSIPEGRRGHVQRFCNVRRYRLLHRPVAFRHYSGCHQPACRLCGIICFPDNNDHNRCAFLQGRK
jgi:fucose permease